MKNAKIYAVLLAIVLCVSIFIACGQKDDNGESVPVKDKHDNTLPDLEDTSKDEPDDKKEDEPAAVNHVEEFMKLVTASEYAKAVEYFNLNLIGNYALEVEAQDSLIAFCEEINNKVLSGEATETQAKISLGVVEKIILETTISQDIYYNAETAVKASVVSKAAFSAGKDFETLSNYPDAIESYKQVLEEDSNYAAAQQAISDCVQKYKDDCFKKAESFVGAKNFVEAIELLKDAEKVLPEESDIKSKITVYEKTYISSAIAEADAAFVTPATDYEKAVKVINSVLQHYPNNEELKAKKDYYNSFAPVKLASLPKYVTSGTYGPTFLEHEKDPLGNTHTDVFRTWSSIYGGAYVVYILDGKYNKLTFTAYGTLPSDNTITAISIRDYSKGDYDSSTYLYLNETMECGAFPYNVEIDVTGVKMIRVYVEYGVAVADAVVQRTVK